MTTHTFPNGFRLIYEKPKNSLEISSIIAFCNLGAVHEHSGILGVSHFIEHMCFKGTKKIKVSKKIFETFDNVGTYYNASTNKRYTQYDIKCGDENTETSIHLLSDMLLNSVFDKKEYTKEHQVVIEENLQDSEDSESIMADATELLLYSGSPFEHPIDHIKYHKGKHAMPYDAVIETYKTYYTPGNIVLSVVSNVPFKKIISFIEKSYFATMSSHPVPCLEWRPLTTSSKGPEYTFLKGREKNVCYLSIAFNVCNQYSTDKFILNYIRSLLGGPFSSRLFMTLREYNGLTYSIDVDTQYFEIGGDFTISTVCDDDKLIRNGDHQGVLPLIMDVIGDLISNGVSKSEFDIIKNYIKGKLLLAQEDNTTIAEHNGEYTLLYSGADGFEFTRYRDVYDKYYKPMTQEDVHAAVKKYFTKENMKVCIVGDVNKKMVQSVCEKTWP